jgi:uncharacterized damage-inducible protein DinB
MTIALNRLLAHMSWANQKTIAHLQTLPDAYAFRITGKHPQLPGDSIPEIGVIADLALIAKQAAAIDAALLESVSLDDEQLEFTNYSGKLVKRWRSTILSQAIHHATEHRAQIASALEAKGFTPVDLDELDLWAFEIEKN